MFTSVLYTVLQFAGTNILTRRMADATEVYGTFASLIVLAFWISIHSLIALLGAEINAGCPTPAPPQSVRRRRSAPGGRDQGPPARVRAEQDVTVAHLFVYGTLQPGDVRWPILAPYVADAGVPTTSPAACTTRVAATRPRSSARPARSSVARITCGADLLDEALAVLDEEESSVPGGYRRVVVTTTSGQPTAWAYEYGGGLELTDDRVRRLAD